MEDQARIKEICAEVHEMFPKIDFPDPVYEPVWYGRREKTLVGNQKAIVNQKDGGVFAICTDAYKIVRHEEIIHTVKQSLDALEGKFGTYQICPELLGGGAKLVVRTKFSEHAWNFVKAGNSAADVIYPKIEAFSSYDLGWKFNGRWGIFNQRCSNGVGVWKSFKAYAKRHLQSLNISSIRDSMLEGMGIFDSQIEQWKLWAETRIDQMTYDNSWDELPFSATEKGKIEALPETGTQLLLPNLLQAGRLDLWTFNSILTQFATHEVKSDLRRLDLEPQIARAMEIVFDYTS